MVIYRTIEEPKHIRPYPEEVTESLHGPAFCLSDLVYSDYPYPLTPGMSMVTPGSVFYPLPDSTSRFCNHDSAGCSCDFSH